MTDPIPRRSGVYALRHRDTKKLYIGSAKNLDDRKAKWWNFLNTQKAAAPKWVREMVTSRHDWDFLILWSADTATPEDLAAAETRVVAAIQAKAPDRLLNISVVRRQDLGALTVGTETQTLRAWSKSTGVPRSTIALRRKYGWSPEQAIGAAPAPVRDHSSAHIQQSLLAAHVVIYDGDQPLSNADAAMRLNCKTNTLRDRLRRYRVPGGQGRVQLADLQALSTQFRQH